jgi:hypothetical protein
MDKAKPPVVSLADRLAHGHLTVLETRILKSRSHSGFYEDVKRGLVTIEKHGRKSTVRGPVAMAYIENRAIPKATRRSDANSAMTIQTPAAEGAATMDLAEQAAGSKSVRRSEAQIKEN